MSLLIALVGGLVLAGLAGAERTRTAVDRMIAYTEPFDALINPSDGDESRLDYDMVAALPMVADMSRMYGVGAFSEGPYGSIDELFSAPLIMATDGGSTVRFDRPLLSAGRVPSPDSLDEVVIERNYAASEDLDVGDTMTIRIFPPEVLGAAFEALDAGEFDAGVALLSDPSMGTTADMRVAGIGTWIDGIVVDEGFEPVAAWMGPAMYESLGSPSAGFGGAVVRLRDPDDLAAFTAAVDALAPDEKVVYQTQAVSVAKAIRSTQPAATALAIFAVVTASLGLLLIGQAISRRVQLDALDNDTLAAIGATREERFVSSMVRLALAAIAGAVLAVGLAALLSVFTPVGPARFAEPDPGFSFDSAVLVGGMFVFVVAVVAIAIVPAWHGARLLERSASTRGSTIATWLAARGASVSLTTGVRFGLEPGRGSSAVPTRATIIGAVTAVTVAVATIVFASSLDRVVDEPRFYGSNFDVAVDFDGDIQGDADGLQAALAVVARDEAVARSGELRIGEILIGGQQVTTLSFSSGPDAVPPTIATGRAPTALGEVALGATTMRELGVGVGDTIALDAPGFVGDAIVVGRVVLPGVGLYQGSDRTSIGIGALVVPDTIGVDIDSTKSSLVVEYSPGADAAAAEERLGESLAPFGQMFFQSNGRPSDIQSLDRLRSLPVVLAGVLVVLVSVTVLHAMVVAVRRRRRDVAILQALGSTSRSVTAIGMWQGTTIGVAALAFGVPFGIVVGRWVWILLANAFGTLAEPVVPVTGVAAMVVAVLVLAAVAGLVPIRRGLRHHPAEALRSE